MASNTGRRDLVVCNNGMESKNTNYIKSYNEYRLEISDGKVAVEPYNDGFFGINDSEETLALKEDLLEKLENGLEDVFPNNVEVELVESDCINILDLTTVIYDPETEFSEETEYEVYFDTPMELGAIAKLVFAVPFENSVEYYVVDAIGNENGCPGFSLDQEMANVLKTKKMIAISFTD